MESLKNNIIRLSQYKNTLSRMKSLGFNKIYSDNIADTLGISSALVRKDFSEFNIKGNKKGGYVIDELLDQLNGILGTSGVNKIIIVGIGKIGKALLDYKGFQKEGLKITAGFDIDPTKTDTNCEIPILPSSELNGYILKNKIDTCIMTVPQAAAQQVMEELVEAGIKGILNFAPIQLISNSDVVIFNHSIELELENLIYFVNKLKKKKRK